MPSRGRGVPRAGIATGTRGYNAGEGEFERESFELVDERGIAPSITVAELQYGVAKSKRPEQNALALAAFLAPIGVEAFSDAAASPYGPLRADFERKGTPIGSLDLLIAAHALALGRTLVTNNSRAFGRVVGLKVENWAEGDDERR